MTEEYSEILFGNSFGYVEDEAAYYDKAENIKQH